MEGEQRIFATFGSTLLQDSDTSPHGILNVPIVSHQAELESLESLHHFRLENPQLTTESADLVDAVLFR